MYYADVMDGSCPSLRSLVLTVHVEHEVRGMSAASSKQMHVRNNNSAERNLSLSLLSVTGTYGVLLFDPT